MKQESEKFSEKESKLEEERDGLREEINQLEISFVEVETERKRLEETSTNSAELQTVLKKTERLLFLIILFILLFSRKTNIVNIVNIHNYE